MEDLLREVPATPAILITSDDSTNLTHLRKFTVDEVVRESEIATRLRSVVDEVTARDFLEAWAVAIENAPWLGSDVCEVLPTVARAVPLIRSENKLAVVTKRRVWRIWEISSEIFRLTDYKILDVMHAIGLFRITALSRTGLSLREAVRKFLLPERTPREWARNLFDVKLKSIAKNPELVEDWLRAFVRDLLRGKRPRARNPPLNP